MQGSTGVKTVYGDAITAEGKTIIPVARVAYGFGAGTGPLRKTEGGEQKEAGGGGGGIRIKPVGVLEITKEETKFVPINENRKLMGALFIGLLLGLWIGRRRSRD